MAPPPPLCLPFVSKKPKRRLSFSSVEPTGSFNPMAEQLERKNSKNSSYSTTSTLTSAAERLTFASDSEKYDDVPQDLTVLHFNGRGSSKLIRSNTMTGTKKSTSSSKWGYGWGLGKQKEKEQDLKREMSQRSQGASTSPLPTYQPPVRSNSRSTQASRSTQNSQDTYRSQNSHHTQSTHHSKSTHRSQHSRASPSPLAHYPSASTSATRPAFRPSDSSSTLVGSAYERKLNEVDSVITRVDTSDRLDALRKLMAKDDVHFYIIPSQDAHQSEYVAPSDRRREYICGFSGTDGTAIVTPTEAYLITDSRYWEQASRQLDSNWTLVRAGARGEPNDWTEWLVSRTQASRIGIDGRMISYEKISAVTSKIDHQSKMVYLVQNLVDLVWRDKPAKSMEPVYMQPIEFTGEHSSAKIQRIRDWIRSVPPDLPSYSRGKEPTPAQMHDGTIIASLPAIAYILNLRGSDIPFNPLFHAYLYISLDKIIVFVERVKLNDQVVEYLDSLGVEQRSYGDIWSFIRKREWGEGKIVISPQTSYTIYLVLSHYRCTVVQSFAETMMANKNEVEVEGFRRAYLRDGASFVRFFAWLDHKFASGYEITEWEAAQRLTEFRRHNKHFMGLAYGNISASGPNAALPHYEPKKATAAIIDKKLPYVNDSGGQYRDGTTDTTRTIHFGRPDNEICEAYTRVLQGHIAIDTAVFPQGTSGRQLDVLARKALWKDGLNYLHGTGHGIGSFLTVHEGPHGFSSDVPLMQGHVVTNEPGYYKSGQWGVRIESALVVRRIKTRGEFNGPIWLGFERLTCVPIQTRMVKESMLTKEEKQWLKDHNQRCLDKLTPLLKDDKRALAWLKREAQRGIGLAAPAPGGLTVDWD